MYFKDNHFKKWEIALLLALCAACLTGMWAAGQQQDLSDKLIRLHVVAVSDSEREQSVKYEVRDEILKLLEPEFRGISDRENAQTKILDLLPAIESAALKVASANGGNRGAVVTLDKEAYPTRYYDGFALPAGEYLSLRVILGEGKGQNWWCVVFPPLCAAAAEGIANCEAASLLEGDDIAFISEDDGYEIRFKVLEWWGKLKQFAGE